MSDAEVMRDHWWWRPGWQIGRKMYTWHITFDGQEDLQGLVAVYQEALKPLPGLDLIPARWLHLTMQGVGFIDEVSEHDVRSIADAALTRCASLTPFQLTFGAPKVDPEAIMFALHPAEPARELRRQVRAAIGDVWGSDKIPESEEWAPHVSIAYSNSEGSARPLAEALSGVHAEPAILTVSNVELIVLNRDNKMYEWDVFASAPLAG